jgi:hypothetical protein
LENKNRHYEENIYKSNPDKARQMLTDLTNNFAEKALSETKEKFKK